MEPLIPELVAPDPDDDIKEPLIDESLPDNSEITGESTLVDVKQADMRVYNFILRAMDAAWNECRTIGDVCKMAHATADILKKRRQALCLPTEYIGPSKKSDDTPLGLELYQ